MIKGVSKNEPIETNKLGGIQSASPYGMHLLSQDFLDVYYRDDIIDMFYNFLNSGNNLVLLDIIDKLRIEFAMSKENVLLTISEVRKEACNKYPINNWKLIPCEEHINHAIVHYLALRAEDDQDDHLGHCLCRLMFACSTEFSKDYTDARSIN